MSLLLLSTVAAGNATTMTADSILTSIGLPGGPGAVPTVLVTDSTGAPVSGVIVTFAVTSGGGSGTGLTPTTGADGLATPASWTLGSVPGINTMEATAALTGSPIDFVINTFPPLQGGSAASQAQTRSFRSWEPQIVKQRAAAYAASQEADGRAPLPRPLPTRQRVGKPAPAPVGAEFIPAAKTLKGIN